MAIEFENPLTAGTVLIREAIQSQNFQTGVSGWKIEADGDAEFNNLTIRGEFLGNNFVLNSDGLFLYNGTPAAGNLVASIAPTFGTDPYGNDYLDGVVTYVSGSFAGISQGGLLVGDVADGYPTAGAVTGLGTHSLLAYSPNPAATPDNATWVLVSGDETVTPKSAAGYPHLDIGASTAGVTGWINGAMVKSSVNAGVSTAETWHAPAFTAPWASTGTFNGNSTFRGLQYRIDAEDNVWILGCATTTGAGNNVFTLPAGYRPPANNRAMVPVQVFDSSAGTVTCSMAQVTEAGVVALNTTISGFTPAAGDTVFFNGKFPLGNVG